MQARAVMETALRVAQDGKVVLSAEQAQAILAALGPWQADGQPCAPQTYQHYKGGRYELVAEATFEASESPMMVYRAGNGSLWIRERKVFFETVEVNGHSVQRFSPMDSVGE